MLVAFVYTVPNFFGESPAVQVSAGRATVKVASSRMAYRLQEDLFEPWFLGTELANT